MYHHGQCYLRHLPAQISTTQHNLFTMSKDSLVRTTYSAIISNIPQPSLGVDTPYASNAETLEMVAINHLPRYRACSLSVIATT